MSAAPQPDIPAGERTAGGLPADIVSRYAELERENERLQNELKMDGTIGTVAHCVLFVVIAAILGLMLWMTGKGRMF